MSVAHVVVLVLSIYLGVGVLFAAVFILRGVGVVDPVAKEAPVAFKLLILPGALALWPILAAKWIGARGGVHPP